jgi:hypothetical protein
MELIDKHPYVSIEHAAAISGIDENLLREWLFDPALYSVKFCKLRNRSQLYADVESVLLIVQAKCPHVTFETLRRHITRNGARRTLTSSQRQQIAAEQQWKCARCQKTLTTFDVDHKEEWCLRANDTRSNLEALCIPCHRMKSQETQRRGDALFEDRIPRQYNEEGELLFSKYFCDA